MRHSEHRQRLLEQAGLINQPKVNLDEIRNVQWSKEFETYMRNRMVMGYFRYGAIGRQSKGEYDYIGSAVRRLQKYQETGNQEYLVDSANLCLVEFVNGDHPQKHFNTIDDGEHTKRKGV